MRDLSDYSSQWVLPKARRLYHYKGSVRFRLEEENEEKKKVKGVDGSSRTVDKAYSDPSENTEALAAGIFEKGMG